MIFSLILALFYYINLPVAWMHSSPHHKAAVVSQALFSEQVVVRKTSKDWVYVETPDHCGGWVSQDVIVARDTPYPATLKVVRLMAHIYNTQEIASGKLTLPYGAQLEMLDASDPQWIQIALPSGEIGYIQKGDVAQEPLYQTPQDLPALSRQFLGLPYTWCGRSSFGFDCSGFVQMLYQQLRIFLPRGARLQILDTRFRTVSLDEAQPGDLIFFGKSPQAVCHVGLYLDDGYFIHASVTELQPWIHISHLSETPWTGEATSTLPYRVIRQLRR